MPQVIYGVNASTSPTPPYKGGEENDAGSSIKEVEDTLRRLPTRV